MKHNINLTHLSNFDNKLLILQTCSRRKQTLKLEKHTLKRVIGMQIVNSDRTHRRNVFAQIFNFLMKYNL